MIDLEDVKAWLGITGTEHDAALTALEERATAIVERALKWYFGPPRITEEVLDGTGTRALFLRQPPADGVVTLYTRGSISDSWRPMAGEAWERRGRGLYAAPGGAWVRGRANFRAVYLEGFEEPPPDIVQLVLDLIAGVWTRRASVGLSSERIGDYAYTMADVVTAPRWGMIRNMWSRGRV